MTDKPKRPMSAYLMWLNSAREDIKKGHPGLRVTEVAKKGGEIWRSMEDKSEWEQKAAKAKEQYAKDLETFNANGGDAGGVVTKKAPKRTRKAKAVPAPAASRKKVKEDNENDDDDDEDEVSD